MCCAWRRRCARAWPQGGVPDAILVDRGSAFVSGQLARSCAVLGIRLIHAAPRAATTKGKIERFFRTVRGAFLVELQVRPPADLAALNRLFSAWLEVVYHRRVHGETKQTPLARLGEGDPPVLPTPALLRDAFMWSQKRTVTKTATVSLHGNQYEVDAALVGQVCEMVFDPFDLERIEVRFQGRSIGPAIPVKIGRRVHPQARADAKPPPASTGIDYLRLVAERHDAELAGRPIDFAALGEASEEDAMPGDGASEDTIGDERPGREDTRSASTGCARTSASRRCRSARISRPGCCTRTARTQRRSRGSAGPSASSRSA
jgi:putative transposase